MPDEQDVSKQCTRCRGHEKDMSNVDQLAQFREWGRQGGKIGGRAVTLAKRRAALRNGRCRRAKPPLGPSVLSP